MRSSTRLYTLGYDFRERQGVFLAGALFAMSLFL